MKQIIVIITALVSLALIVLRLLVTAKDYAEATHLIKEFGGMWPIQALASDTYAIILLLCIFLLVMYLFATEESPRILWQQLRAKLASSQDEKYIDSTVPNMTIGRASNYLLKETLWGDGKGETQIFDALDEAAHSGKLTVCGQRCLTPAAQMDEATSGLKTSVAFSGNESHIPVKDWENIRVAQRFIGFHDNPSIYMPHLTVPRHGEWGQAWGYLRVNESSLQRIWPPRFPKK
jgi:hypothetical protein